MSVLILSDEEYQSLFNTLCYWQEQGKINVIPIHEIEEYKKLLRMTSKGKNRSEHDINQEAIQTKINSFITLLYAANVTAFNYQYGENQKIAISLKEPTLQTLSAIKAYETLSSIDYNVVANNGYSFLGEQQQKRLNDLMQQLGYIFYSFLRDKPYCQSIVV